MDKSEAKVILSAMRVGGPEASSAPFVDAVALAESDPELRAWWRTWQEFDRRVAAKLADVPVPQELRESIIVSRKIAAFPARQSYSIWLAAAAAVALLCVAGTFWHVANYGAVDQTDYTAKVLPMLRNDAPDLAMMSPDHDKLVGWLKAHDAPVGAMPQKVADLASVGCQKYVMHGHIVSLICFSMTGGGVVHLFMVDKDALNDPPAMDRPHFDSVKGWNVASWSDHKMAYLLATQADADSLKQLL